MATKIRNPRILSPFGTALAACAWLVLAFFAGAKTLRAQSPNGTWAMTSSERPGYVQFSLTVSRPGRHMQEESDWELNSFQGLDTSNTARHDVKFSINRDAGRLDCDGFLENGEGAGVFHFFADAKYPGVMSKLGFGDVDADKQFSMAVHDVSIDFARQMKGEHISGLDTDKLIAFRIFGVDKQFIDDLRSSGLNVTDSDKLVAFRIHGVTPDMVRALHQQGYSPDEDTLIALRIHGATPEWIQQMSAAGYPHVELEKLIAFRIHGVSPEFVAALDTLGYHHPDPDQLVAMRIHGVTPQYISDLRSHGMQNLTVDQLVSMRIHGID
jgi:hypothetical protein